MKGYITIRTKYDSEEQTATILGEEPTFKSKRARRVYNAIEESAYQLTLDASKSLEIKVRIID